MSRDTYHPKWRSRREIENQSVAAIVVSEDSRRLIANPRDQESTHAREFAPDAPRAPCRRPRRRQVFGVRKPLQLHQHVLDQCVRVTPSTVSRARIAPETPRHARGEYSRSPRNSRRNQRRPKPSRPDLCHRARCSLRGCRSSWLHRRETRRLARRQFIDDDEPRIRIFGVPAVRSKSSLLDVISDRRKFDTTNELPRTDDRAPDDAPYDYSCFTSRPRMRAFSKIQPKNTIADEKYTAFNPRPTRSAAAKILYRRGPAHPFERMRRRHHPRDFLQPLRQRRYRIEICTTPASAGPQTPTPGPGFSSSSERSFP